MKDSFFANFKNYWIAVGRSMSTLWRATDSAMAYLTVRNERKKEVTEQYPDPVSSRTPDELPSRTRGLLTNDILRCTGCGDCAEVCPNACFKIEAVDGAKPGKKWVAKFDIDYSKCIFCCLCVDVCQPQSLKHSKQFASASLELAGQVRSFGRGPVSDALRAKWMKQRNPEDRSGRS
jgi:hypothetical protein